MDLLAFEIAGVRLGVAADCVDSVRPAAQSDLPLGEALGLEAPPGERALVVRSSADEEAVGLAVPLRLTLLQFDDQHRQPLPALVSARPAITGLALLADGIVVLLDPRALLRDLR